MILSYRNLKFAFLFCFALLAGAGFAQTYKISTGGTVNTCSGTFYDSGGSSSNYGKNENYTMTFCSSAGSCVQLDFTSFNVETLYDRMRIYDGPTTSSPIIGTYDNANVPGIITATTGCLTVNFTSNNGTQGNWAATITCVACPTVLTYKNPTGFVYTCAGTFTDNGGSTANYSNYYTGITKICSSGSDCIKLAFTAFSTESGYDELIIYDGNSTAATVLGTYSGTTSPGTITSSTGCLTLEFSSDGSYNYSGFSANITCGACATPPPPSAQNCSGAIQVCSDQSFSGNSSGSGNVLDLNSSNDDCLYGENQTSWYFFQMKTGGTVELAITPQNGIDDYDFAIWGPMGSLTCPPSATPARCSYSATDGVTGLKAASGDNSEDSAGDKWVNELTTSTGQVYVLVVDNYSESTQPFTLDWTLTNGATLNCLPLPIELVEFNGVQEPGDILLAWETSSELNNDYFIIEKSLDGENYKEISRKDGAGTTSQASLYNYRDMNPMVGNNYYRLIQRDFDGAEKYSAPIVVTYQGSEHLLTGLYPNPAQNHLRVGLYLPVPGEAFITLYDHTGREILTTSEMFAAGASQIGLDLEGLRAGTYSLQFNFAHGQAPQRQMFIKH